MRRRRRGRASWPKAGRLAAPRQSPRTVSALAAVSFTPELWREYADDPAAALLIAVYQALARKVCEGIALEPPLHTFKLNAACGSNAARYSCTACGGAPKASVRAAIISGSP